MFSMSRSRMLSSYFWVSPAVCGVMNTLGAAQRSDDSGNGSSQAQSSAAAAMVPACIAWSSDGSCTTLPRATLTRHAVRFIAAIDCAFMMLSVPGFKGHVRATKSASGSTFINSDWATTEFAAPAPLAGSRLTPITRMSNARASVASRDPMRPMPMITSVLPPSSSSRWAISEIRPRHLRCA